MLSISGSECFNCSKMLCCGVINVTWIQCSNEVRWGRKCALLSSLSHMSLKGVQHPCATDSTNLSGELSKNSFISGVWHIRYRTRFIRQLSLTVVPMEPYALRNMSPNKFRKEDFHFRLRLKQWVIEKCFITQLCPSWWGKWLGMSQGFVLII